MALSETWRFQSARRGENYLRDRKKTPAGEPLMRVVSVQVFNYSESETPGDTSLHPIPIPCPYPCPRRAFPLFCPAMPMSVLMSIT